MTGRYRADNPDLAKRGTTFGRIYMLELNENDPTGDAEMTGILVTENYVYIQEDPNGYFGQNAASRRSLQWNLGVSSALHRFAYYGD